jgi:hypothetical protein
VPTLLVGLPEQERSHLHRTLFGRADMRPTVAEPAEVFAVARTLGPDLVLVSGAAGEAGIKDLIEHLRREPVTHDSIVIVVLPAGGSSRPFETAGAGLVLPHDFADAAGDDVPWAERLEQLLHLRQRREARVLTDLRVQATIQVGGAGPRDLQATCLNISSRGMLLETPDALPLSARAELTFSTGAGATAIALVGEVVRTATTADGRSLAGIHFVVVRKEARLAIRDLLRAERG